jgi:hypothetical protein
MVITSFLYNLIVFDNVFVTSALDEEQYEQRTTTIITDSPLFTEETKGRYQDLNPLTVDMHDLSFKY